MEWSTGYLITLASAGILLLVVGIVVGIYLQRRRSAREEDFYSPASSSPSSPVMHEAPTHIHAEIQALLAQGNKIEAIKVVRAATNWGLKASKTYVETLARQGYAVPPRRVQPEGLTPQVMAEVYDLLARRRKIEAIKRVRDATGWGLKEAKDYVETLI